VALDVGLDGWVDVESHWPMYNVDVRLQLRGQKRMQRTSDNDLCEWGHQRV
jgi:hypothetical protein